MLRLDLMESVGDVAAFVGNSTVAPVAACYSRKLQRLISSMMTLDGPILKEQLGTVDCDILMLGLGGVPSLTTGLTICPMHPTHSGVP